MTDKDLSKREGSDVSSNEGNGDSSEKQGSSSSEPPASPTKSQDDTDHGPVEDLEQPPAGAKETPIEPEIGFEPTSVPYDIGRAQETTRGKIALILLLMLAMVIILAFLYLNSLPLNDKTKIYTDNLVTILQIIFGPLVTLVATALGYYFGSKGDKPNFQSPSESIAGRGRSNTSIGGGGWQ